MIRELGKSGEKHPLCFSNVPARPFSGSPIAAPARPSTSKNAIAGIKMCLSVAVIATAPLLSGCMGSKVNETLESAALNSPNQSDSVADAEFTADYATLETIPVPRRSPVQAAQPSEQSQLALAEDSATPLQQAAADVINTEVTTEVQSGTTEPLPTADPASAASNAQNTQNPPPRPKEVRKPASLFSALFGPRKLRSTLARAPKPAGDVPSTNTSPSENTRIARNNSQSGNALPGVKRNRALFGIGETGSNGKKVLAPDASVKVASVGSFGRFKTVNGLILQTDKVKVECFKPELMRILRIVERRYGKKVMVTSGFRSPKRNRRAGGVRNSTHIYCKAADIQVEGVSKWDLAKFLRSVDGRGGVGTYCRTKSVHIDTGSVRDWHHPCRRSKSRVKRKKT